MSTVDTAYVQPARLYADRGRPPADAWDLQIAAPSPLVAWIEARRQRGQQSGIYILGAGTAFRTVASVLPDVSMSLEHHYDEPQHPHPHVHVMVAAEDLDGRSVRRDQVQDAATEAWVAHVQRMVDYARQRPHLGLLWLPDGGIAGIDHRSVPPFSCTEFDWLQHDPVIGAP